MARKPRPRTNARDIEEPHITQLMCSCDFFDKAFGKDVASMRIAWQNEEVRQQVIERYAKTRKAGKPFAAIAFGDDGTGGMVRTADDIREAYIFYREQGNPEAARDDLRWGLENGLIEQAEYEARLARLEGC